MMLLLLLFGCLRGSIGFEPGLGDPRPAYATVSADFGIFDQEKVFAATAQVRAGAGGAELSAGGFVCASGGAFITMSGCGRVYALDIGWRRDHVSVGVSPAVGVEANVPLFEMGWVPVSHATGNLRVISLSLFAGAWAGADLRVAPISDTTPYGSLQLGVGFRFRNTDAPRGVLSRGLFPQRKARKAAKAAAKEAAEEAGVEAEP